MRKGRWGNFGFGLAGLLVGALLVSAFPAVAANGDPIEAGKRNRAPGMTRLISGKGMTIRSTKPGNPPLTLVSRAGTPPLSVNRDALVDNLNADLLDGNEAADFLGAADQAADSDLLDGFDANGLVRASFSSTSDASDTNGDLVSTSITAPSDGILIVGGALDAYLASTSGPNYITCELQLDDNSIDGTAMQFMVEDQAGDHTGNSDENCSTTGGTYVTAGAHTVSLSISGHLVAGYQQGSVWAIFIPFGGTGSVPVFE